MSARDPDELNVSRNQLDRAGSRVRRSLRDQAPIAESVLGCIDEYRAWHLPTLRLVQSRLSEFFHQQVEIPEGDLPITSRLKTSPAIVAKLGRSRISLPRMQDIAGARIVVPSLEVQEPVIAAVRQLFGPELRHVKDQRAEPDQYGYRAVHLIVRVNGRIAEIQIRTVWQDRWAQIVEQVDGLLSSDLKHGRGPAEWLEWLHGVSDGYRLADLEKPFTIPEMPLDRESEREEER